MPIYTIKKIYHYTITVEVKADSEREALDKASTMEGERNHDDLLYDCEVINERENMTEDVETLRIEVQELRDELEQAFARGWTAAIEAALMKLPGGQSCDPQAVADEIRTLTRNVPAK